MGILAPISSNEIIPTIPDFANHSALIVQAKKALFSGNFPLRIAAWQFNGYQFPVFQFYSSFIYSMSVIIYALFLPNNPYLTLKLMYVLGMLKLKTSSGQHHISFKFRDIGWEII